MAVSKYIAVAVTVLIVGCNFVVCQEEDSSVSEARTFGHHFLKRISFAIIPGAFVIGAVTTLLGALTVVSMKGLGVGVILLILTIGQLLSKSLPHVHAAPLAAPVPVVYSHTHSQQPVWLEKEW